MAAGNLFVVADRIRNLLDCDETVKEMGSLFSEPQNPLVGLKQQISKLALVLLDAEKKSQHNKLVRDWLMELEDVLYDADNLLDYFSTEALRRGSTKSTGNKMAKQVRSDFSSSMLKDVRSVIEQVEKKGDDIEAKRVVLDSEDCSVRIANLVKDRSYPLSDLNEKQSLILFEEIAFRQGQESNMEEDGSYQILVGKEIIKRCDGHPLVIMAVASMLRHIKQWRIFYKKEIPKLGKSYNRFASGSSYTSDQKGIQQLLKLCYDHLPSPLKHCFAYCSLFPRGHEIDVQMLIQLWMAQGFIIEKSKNLEDAGYEYFLILLGRYFLQEVERDATKRVSKCKIHDLMHDLAISVAGDQCRLLSSSDDYIGNVRTFHVRFDFDLTSTKDFAKSDAKKIRSIVYSGRSRRRYTGVPVNTIFNEIAYRFTFLRALDMHASGIEIVPSSIGKLKLLKYLDLSENEEIVELPISVTELLNLQTLRLSSCFKLKNLPGGFGNLANLRHLEIDGCNNLTSIPKGIKGLKYLKELSQLVVSEDSSAPDGVINKLREFTALKLIENFQIRNLRLNLRHEKYVGEYLKEIPSNIRSMSLEMGVHELESASDETDLKWNLPPDLEELSINGFVSVTLLFPDDYLRHKLVNLSFSRCAKCKTLPFGYQFNLKVLVLDHNTDLEYILDSDSSSTTLLVTLEELWLTELPKLRSWWKDSVDKLPSFHRLSKLVIEDCPKLVSMPRFPNLEEGLVLDRTSWILFELTMKPNTEEPTSSNSPPPLSNLRNLRIVGIEDWEADKIKWGTLKNLQFLRYDCLPMKTLPDGLKEVTSLQELQVWRCGIRGIPEWIGELQKLKKLVIRMCPSLEELPSGVRGLHSLEIEDSDILLRRCEQRTGADWSKIAKIPERKLGLTSRRSSIRGIPFFRYTSYITATYDL